MSSPPDAPPTGRWGRLGDRLRDAPARDGYRERLHGRVDVWQEQERLEHDLRSEVMSALARSEHKVARAFSRLDELATLLTKAPDPESAARTFDAQRELARRALWELVVHREAIGFRRHDELEARYRLPPPAGRG